MSLKTLFDLKTIFFKPDNLTPTTQHTAKAVCGGIENKASAAENLEFAQMHVGRSSHFKEGSLV